VVTARRTDHRTTPSTPPSLPPSRDVKRPPVRIGWNRSIDRSDRQTDRQTDRRFRLRLPKKNAHRRRFQSSRNSRVFLSIDPIDRFPIETRSKPAISSVVPDRFDSTRSIRVRFDSVLIRYRYRFDRTRESIGGFYRSNAHRVAVRRTVRRFRRTVGRSVDSRSLSTSSDGYTDRTDRYRETPTRGRAGETDRYDSSSDSSSDSTDGRTDARTTRIHPSIGTHHPSGRPPRRYEQRYLLSLTKSVCRSVGSGRRALSRASGVRSVSRNGFGCLYSSKEAEERLAGKAGESSDGRARTRTRITEDEEVV